MPDSFSSVNILLVTVKCDPLLLLLFFSSGNYSFLNGPRGNSMVIGFYERSVIVFSSSLLLFCKNI